VKAALGTDEVERTHDPEVGATPEMPEQKALSTFVTTCINLTQWLGESKIRGLFSVQIEGLNNFNTIFIA
jgi:hypothetical protein